MATTRPPRLHYRHAEARLARLDDGPLAGLRHRTVIDGTTGARALALWQEEHLPGFEVPLHRHDCEEIIAVVEGEIEAAVGEERFQVAAGESFLIPEWAPHGFRVAGCAPVRLLALFASASPGIFRLDGSRSAPPWEGGSSDHLDADGSSRTSLPERSC
jgi:quercetin dioxygenase-like cupin family protein